MSDEIQRLARRMEKDGRKTIAYFRGLPEDAWERRVYTTGSEWRVRDVLAHFVSAERSFKLLIADIAAGGEGAPRDMDIVEFNEEEVPKLDALPVEELLTAFHDARKDLIALTVSLAPDDLAKTGYHPWFGDVELQQMLKLVYRHNMIHLRDIRKALRDGSPVPHKDIMPPAKTD